MFKFLTKADYLLKETLLGLRRGGWMNWAAVSTMTVLLFLFGISLQTSWQVEGLINQFGSQLEISAYLNSGIEAAVVVDEVRQLPHVVQVTPITKEDAWAQLAEELSIADITSATDQLKGNPLVDALRVKVDSADAVPTVADRLGQLSSVDEVLYVSEAVQRLAELNQGLQWASLFVIGILSLTAIAVTTTTIRLIVMARRREIEVMQLVGATSAWIYLPFILQGTTFGIVGALVAWGMLLGLQEFLQQIAAQQADFVQFLVTGLRLDRDRALLLPTALVALGSGVGLIGSLFAVRKFAVRS
ncbi:MAG: ABC transporter permease [Cyanobacteria bacterium P01_A01_bin.105]